MQKETRFPFISIIDEVIEHGKFNGYKRIGLLASPITMQSKLYQTSLSTHGFDVVLPNQEHIQLLGESIGQIVSGEYEEGRDYLLYVADLLKDKQVDALLLGCTEIPLVFPKNIHCQ